MHAFPSKINALLALFGLLFLGCATPKSHPQPPLLAQKLPFDPDTLSFQTAEGRTIKLILQSDDYEQTSHPDLPSTFSRGPTTSYYQELASGKILAESSHSPDMDWQFENLEIRQSRDGKILISEDTSDGLPSVRHILLDGDKATYLHPGHLYPSGQGRQSASVYDLQLLATGHLLHKDQAIEPLSLRHSKTPFSAGG